MAVLGAQRGGGGGKRILSEDHIRKYHSIKHLEFTPKAMGATDKLFLES